MNSELAYGEFIKPYVESENEKVTCGLKRFLTPNRFDQQKRQSIGSAFSVGRSGGTRTRGLQYPNRKSLVK